MAWLLLVLGGIMEWGWPIGLKVASVPGRFRVAAAGVAAICMILSGLFLYFAQRTLPVGTAYAVWTGIGVVGTFVLGMVLLKEPVVVARFVFVGLIILGMVGLRLTSTS